MHGERLGGIPEPPPRLPVPFFAVIAVRGLMMGVGESMRFVDDLDEHDIRLDVDNIGQPVPELTDFWPVYGDPHAAEQQDADRLHILLTVGSRAVSLNVERRQTATGTGPHKDIIPAVATLHYVRPPALELPLESLPGVAVLTRSHVLIGPELGREQR